MAVVDVLTKIDYFILVGSVPTASEIADLFLKYYSAFMVAYLRCSLIMDPSLFLISGMSSVRPWLWNLFVHLCTILKLMNKWSV